MIEVTDTYGDVLVVSRNDEGEVAFESQDGSTTDFVFDQDAVDSIADYLRPAADNTSVTDPNEAKLRLAAEYGMRAKFEYQGEYDSRSHERRVEPDDVRQGTNGLLVAGESYDEDGESEGYRQFYLGRIRGKVAIR